MLPVAPSCYIYEGRGSKQGRIHVGPYGCGCTQAQNENQLLLSNFYLICTPQAKYNAPTAQLRQPTAHFASAFVNPGNHAEDQGSRRRRVFSPSIVCPSHLAPLSASRCFPWHFNSPLIEERNGGISSQAAGRDDRSGAARACVL